MSGCCQPGDLDDLFSPAFADRDARRYRKDGLGSETRAIAEVVKRIGLDGLAVLEVGGGIGANQLELLRAGASRATNVELSRSYEAAATQLIEAAGLSGRIDRRVGDFVAEAEAIPPADAVILERVVCCYPDASALVAAAARHATRILVLTMPVDSQLGAFVAAVINVWPRLRGWKFRFYLHPTAAVVAAAEAQGMRLGERQKGFVWQMLVFRRETVAA